MEEPGMSNEILSRLPKHLMDLIVNQHYELYTPQDHALWRYVMRQNTHYLSQVAHESYLQGLKSTGISIERIPNIDEMNEKLGKIGWATVAVDGFIPPSAFMEFQAYHVLVIAADIRPIDQIGYTPAPDIIHEAAGHAPIIADPRYAEYLRKFGEIGHRAFQSENDYKLYEAIRHLSILKADPYTSEQEISEAMQELSQLERNMGEPSEMAKIRNLHWWTVEYGLVGDIDRPKIYGAGLLSSISESYNCLLPKVKKMPYTLAASEVGFDITEEQPQLFVTPDFDVLNEVLEQFAEGMALRRGGLDGLKKAKLSKSTATIEYSSGLQVSGTLGDYHSEGGQAKYIQFDGATALSVAGRQLAGHGKTTHAHGFGSPVGKWKASASAPELLDDSDLEALGIRLYKSCHIEFESGVCLEGIPVEIIRRNRKNLIISFDQATVKLEDKILFHPEWGRYDMAVGESIVSAFAGPADAEAFGLAYPVPAEKTHKINHSEASQLLNKFYGKIRDIRENNAPLSDVTELWRSLSAAFPNDWLAPLEILELVNSHPAYASLAREVKASLEAQCLVSTEIKKLIEDGMQLI